VSEGKERLESILASIQDAFVSLDTRKRYSFVNANAAVLLGAKKEGTKAPLATLSIPIYISTLKLIGGCTATEMLGHNVWRYMVDTEEQILARNMERAMHEKLDLVFDYYYASRDRWYVQPLIN
jgi:PAS domain-containing protein